MLDIWRNGRDNTKDSAAAFSLRSLQKQNGWVQRSKNNVKNIMGISIAYWGT